jgi:hypothetical protein
MHKPHKPNPKKDRSARRPRQDRSVKDLKITYRRLPGPDRVARYSMEEALPLPNGSLLVAQVAIIDPPEVETSDKDKSRIAGEFIAAGVGRMVGLKVNSVHQLRVTPPPATVDPPKEPIPDRPAPPTDDLCATCKHKGFSNDGVRACLYPEADPPIDRTTAVLVCNRYDRGEGAVIK